MGGEDDHPHGGEITELLQEWGHGNRAALERLTPLVYDELRRMAARQLSRERPGHLLQRTALVHEAFVKLCGQRAVDWQNRAHFYGLAAQAMRRILVDHARLEGREKRGAGIAPASLDGIDVAGAGPDVDAVDVIALDRALTKLEAMDATGAKVVELRFYGGLTVEETADAMGVSTGTIKREWAVAKAWLFRELGGAAV